MMWHVGQVQTGCPMDEVATPPCPAPSTGGDHRVRGGRGVRGQDIRVPPRPGILPEGEGGVVRLGEEDVQRGFDARS